VVVGDRFLRPRDWGSGGKGGGSILQPVSGTGRCAPEPPCPTLAALSPLAFDGADERLFWVGKFDLRFGQCGGECRDRGTRPLHGFAPRSRSIGRSSPPLTWSAWRARHDRSPPWRPPAPGL